MAAFIPGASPPEVNSPIVLILAIVLVVLGSPQNPPKGGLLDYIAITFTLCKSSNYFDDMQQMTEKNWNDRFVIPFFYAKCVD
jgi:hypothetical protein